MDPNYNYKAPIEFSIEHDKLERVHKWVAEHPCKLRGKYQGAIGGAITYSFTDTTIGQIQTVKCACGGEHFISDDL